MELLSEDHIDDFLEGLLNIGASLRTCLHVVHIILLSENLSVYIRGLPLSLFVDFVTNQNDRDVLLADLLDRDCPLLDIGKALPTADVEADYHAVGLLQKALRQTDKALLTR